MCKIKKVSLIIILFFIIICIQSKATKAAKIEGYIKDEGGNVCSNIDVKLKKEGSIGNDTLIKTDENGYFCFDGLENGRYAIETSDEVETKDANVYWYEFSGNPWVNSRIVTAVNKDDSYENEVEELSNIMKYAFSSGNKKIETENKRYLGISANEFATLLENPPPGFDTNVQNKGILCIWVNDNSIEWVKKYIENISMEHPAKTVKGYNSMIVVAIPTNENVLNSLKSFRETANWASWLLVEDYNNRVNKTIEKMCSTELLDFNAEYKNDKDIGNIKINTNYAGEIKKVEIQVKTKGNNALTGTGNVEIETGVKDKDGKFGIYENMDSNQSLVADSVEIKLKDANGSIIQYNSYDSVLTNGDKNTLQYNISSEGNYIIEYTLLSKAFDEGYNKYNFLTNEVNGPVTYAKGEEEKADDWNTGKLILTKDIEVTKDSNGDFQATSGIVELKERNKLWLDVEIKISAVKVVLADGSIFYEKTGSELDAINSPSGNAEGVITMDNEIMHGATAYVEYEVTVKNNKVDTNTENMNAEDVKVYAYLDRYITKGGITFDKDGTLITEQATNTDQGWTAVSNPESLLYDRSQKVGNVIENDFGDLQCEDEISKKFVISQLITSEVDAEYKASAEIVQYTQDKGQRNGQWKSGIENSYNRAGYGLTSEAHPGTERETIGKITILPPFGIKMNIFNRFSLIK